MSIRRAAPAGLRLRQPISAPADQTGQHLLRVSAALPVERDPLADGEVISKTTHAGCLPALKWRYHATEVVSQ
jgi:hypothetical protein